MQDIRFRYFSNPNDLDVLLIMMVATLIILLVNIFILGYYYPIDKQKNWAIEPSILLKKTKMSKMQYHFNS